MDFLENYKKVWANQPEDPNKLSAVDIYKMAHSKSSSIVKWIFIIGILEFVILNSLYFIVDMEKGMEMYDELGLTTVVYFSQIFTYCILIYFLYQFYINYRQISVIESTKKLLSNIVKTRKTVRNYVIFNLANFVLIIVIVSVATLNTNYLDFNTKQIAIFIVLMVLVTIFLVGILYLFYQLLYGILLKKLHKNYKEISKLDELN